MAERPKPKPLAMAGFAIAVVAFAFILALGFSRQTVGSADGSSTVACGSVFVPEEDPLCDGIHSSRRTLLAFIGAPGVVLGLGIVVAGSWKERPG